jgi:Na+-driven multidrug efflux pump
LMIHIWAGVFGGCKRKVAVNWKLTNINTAIGAVVNVLLNYILIKEIGVEGATLQLIVLEKNKS